MNTNAYPEISAVDYILYNTPQGFTPVPGNKWPPLVHEEACPGPWEWQWINEMCEIVSAPSSSVPISIIVLLDSIEKVGAIERACVSHIADEEHLDCTWDEKNCHGSSLLKITRVPFHHQRKGHGGSPQEIRQLQGQEYHAPARRSGWNQEVDRRRIKGEEETDTRGKDSPRRAVIYPYLVDAGRIADGWLRGDPASNSPMGLMADLVPFRLI